MMALALVLAPGLALVLVRYGFVAREKKTTNFALTRRNVRRPLFLLPSPYQTQTLVLALALVLVLALALVLVLVLALALAPALVRCARRPAPSPRALVSPPVPLDLPPLPTV